MCETIPQENSPKSIWKKIRQRVFERKSAKKYLKENPWKNIWKKIREEYSKENPRVLRRSKKPYLNYFKSRRSFKYPLTDFFSNILSRIFWRIFIRGYSNILSRIFWQIFFHGFSDKFFFRGLSFRYSFADFPVKNFSRILFQYSLSDFCSFYSMLIQKENPQTDYQEFLHNLFFPKKTTKEVWW